MTQLVWAQTEAGVIGRDGGLPWHLPEDLALFRALTVDQTVVMGRSTWESLPERFRPLPRRRNLVLSRTVDRLDGAEVVGLDDVPGDAWVIGGAQVYAALLPGATVAVTTVLRLDVAGDAFAPELDDAWLTTVRPWYVGADGTAFTVVVRRRPGVVAEAVERVVDERAAGWTAVS